MAPGGPPPPRLPSGTVTFLFTDIEGSTTLWDLHPGEMALALVRHDEVVDDAVRRAGGHLLKAKGEGDSTVSVFERPDDAVRAAHRAQAALAATTFPGDLLLRVRMAVHTGEAELRDGDYYGPTLNRTARIRGFAGGGVVLVSGATAALVADDLPPGTALLDQGSRLLRGITGQERLYSLVADASVDGGLVEVPPVWAVPAAIRRSAASGRMVGREEPLERLRRVWKSAAASTVSVALVSGEPGIGKTRLAATFADEVAVGGGIVLYGRCEEDMGAPHQPFADGLRHYLDQCPPALFRDQAGSGLSELTRILPEVADRFTGLGPPSSAERDIEELLLFDAVAGLLRRAAQAAPVLLIVDDLHWASEPTLRLLRHLVSELADERIALLAFYRDNELDRRHPLAAGLGSFRTDPAVERIALDGLPLAEVALLLADRAGQPLDELGIDLAGAIEAQTNGNPFFVDEVLRNLTELGALQERDGRWVSTIPIEQLDLPEGIREVIGRRLSRLAPGTEAFLRVAAVMGQTFSLPVCEAVVGGDEDEAIDALDEGTAAGVLLELGPGQFAFVHALTRQTILAELTVTRRVRLHRKIGEALAVVQPDEVEALAFHFGEAAVDGCATLAADYALAAARRAMAGTAADVATRHLEAGLAHLELAPTPDPARRADLLIALANAFEYAGLVSRGDDAAQAALVEARLAGDPVRLAAAAIALVGHGALGAGGAAGEVLREVLEVLGDEHAVWRSRVQAALAYHVALNESDVPTARPLADAALASARRLDDDETLAWALQAAAISRMGTPEVAERVALAEELVALGERSESHAQRGLSVAWIVAARLEQGDLAGFRAGTEAMAELAERTGAWGPGYTSRSWLAVLAYLAGDMEEARRCTDQVLRHGPDDPNSANVWAANSLLIERDLGNQASILPVMASARESNPNMHVYRCAEAQLLAELGDHEHARAVAAPLLADGLAGLPVDQTLTSSVIALSEALGHGGADEGTDLLLQAMLPFRGLVVAQTLATYVGGACDRAIGILAGMAGRWDLSFDAFERGLAIEAGLGSPTLQARTALWYARMLRRRSGSGDAERAEELLHAVLAWGGPSGLLGLTRPAAALLETG
jgi:class 3 adenylate cyclase/tetratricopeptide (TPR) repeat protein